MPGSIVSSLRKVGVSDPVILLDEVDKLGSGNGMHGDPMAAMLEVLDPEQNHNFNDHYVNCPIDLSKGELLSPDSSLHILADICFLSLSPVHRDGKFARHDLPAIA